MINNKQHRELIEQLYETAFNVQAWDDVVESITCLFRSSISTLMLQNSNSGLASLKAVSNINDNDARLYTEYYGTKSILVPYANKYDIGEVFTDQMIPDRDVYLNSEAYNDYFRPKKADHLIQTMIDKNSSLNTVILCRRGHQEGPYSQDEINDFKQLYPHFRQAIRVQQSLSKVKSHASALTDTIECMNTGVLLVDHQGKVIFYNQALEEILSDNDGIAIDRNGRLVLPLREELDSFRHLLGKVCGQEKLDEIHPGDAMRSSRPSFKRPYNLWISRVHQTIIKDDLQPAAIIFISDLEKAHDLLPQMISHQFGLTPAETRLTTALAEGKSLTDAAVEFGVATSTMRTILKNIFLKTDTNRQSELVSLVLSMPKIKNQMAV